MDKLNNGFDFNSLNFLYFLVFFICLASLSFGFYLEWFDRLEPCPLCIIQRLSLTLGGLWSLLGGVIFFIIIRFNNKKFILNILNILNLIFSGLSGLLFLLGAIAAGRQIYIQHLPLSAQGLSACAPGWDYLWKALSFNDFLAAIFQGDGVCASIGPRFLSLSLSEWSGLLFLVLIFLVLWILCRPLFSECAVKNIKKI